MYEIKEVCFIGIIIDFSNFSVIWLLLDLMGEESPDSFFCFFYIANWPIKPLLMVRCLETLSLDGELSHACGDCELQNNKLSWTVKTLFPKSINVYFCLILRWMFCHNHCLLFIVKWAVFQIYSFMMLFTNNTSTCRNDVYVKRWGCARL